MMSLINSLINNNRQRLQLAVGSEVVEHDLELGRGLIDLLLEAAYNAVAAADWVGGAGVGLEDDGAHGDVLHRRLEAADDLDDFSDSKEAVGVQELLLAVMGEVGGEEAVGVALPVLKLARSAGLNRDEAEESLKTRNSVDIILNLLNSDIMSVKPTVALRAILVGGIAAFAKIGGAMKAAGGVKLGAAAAAVSAAATAAVSGSKQEVKDAPEQSSI
ncbi:hypothetical protein AAHA92_09508 [Salvia divinorum]|uniref:Uncharacterized protein n=1 Tax=Salvia divinorum TaxID=28513 RepID=A0ABD1HRQ1_SALDI